MTEGSQLIRGLEGVVAAETKLCDLDGANGRLAYGGYDIDDLARKATLRGGLPTCSGTASCPRRPSSTRLTLSLIAARDIPPSSSRPSS